MTLESRTQTFVVPEGPKGVLRFQTVSFVSRVLLCPSPVVTADTGETLRAHTFHSSSLVVTHTPCVPVRLPPRPTLHQCSSESAGAPLETRTLPGGPTDDSLFRAPGNTGQGPRTTRHPRHSVVLRHGSRPTAPTSRSVLAVGS